MQTDPLSPSRWSARRALAACALGLGLPLLAAGCSGGKQGGQELLVYTAYEDDQYPAFLEDFQKQHPEITVTVQRDSTGVIMAKVLAEKENPRADVLWGIALTEMLTAKREGILSPYAPKGLDKLDPRFRDKTNPPLWTGNDAFMTAFCVNTIEVKNKNLPIPKSYADLADPRLAGQVVSPNPASSGTGFMTVSGILQTLGEDKGWAVLDGLHKNTAQYVHSGSQPCKMAGAGEYAVGVSFDYRGFKQKAEGQPIEVILPEEGSGWDVEANGLVKKPKINPTAKTFLDWAINESAMKLYGENAAVLGLKGAAKAPEGYPADPAAQLGKNDFDWAAENRPRLLEEWTKRYDGKSAAKE